MDGHRLSPPVKLDTFGDRLFVFERERSHVLLVAAVEDLDRFGAQAAGGPRGIDGGVARPDDDDAATDLEIVTSLVASDEIESVGDPRMVFGGNAEFVHGAEPDAEEDSLIFV